MTSAHMLLEDLGLIVARSEQGRYPATSEGPTPLHRYWATAAHGEVQFGIQVREQQGTIGPHIETILEPFGFRIRPNGREIYFPLSENDPLLVPRAQIAKAVLDFAMLPKVFE